MISQSERKRIKEIKTWHNYFVFIVLSGSIKIQIGAINLAPEQSISYVVAESIYTAVSKYTLIIANLSFYWYKRAQKKSN